MLLACMLHADLGRGALCIYMGRPDIQGAPFVYKGGSLYIKGGSLVFAALSDGLMSYCLVLSCGVLFLVRVGVCFCVGGNRRKGGT